MGLQIYKKGQGKFTRLATGLVAGAMIGWGCLSLYDQLNAWLSVDSLGENAKAWYRAGIPVALFAVFALLIFKLVNWPKFADFMIQTEGEMKKVSWSSKQEIIGSTKVVIITVVFMAALLFGIDICFRMFFQLIGVLVAPDAVV